MPTTKNKTIDAPLSSAELFCNMTGGMAFRIVEMYKNIRTSLLFTLSDDKEHIVVITSAEPNSGKSVTTANLGLSFAQTGAKVLIIDCDMRNPSQQKIFEQDNTQGLSNVLSNMCTFEDTVKHDVFENLDILTAGQTPPNPSELLASQSFELLLRSMEEQYDYIILDCPAGIEQGFQNAIAAADRAIVVTTPEVSAIRDADRIVGLLEANDFSKIDLVVNRVRNDLIKRGDMMSINDVVDILSIPLLGFVPDDENVVIATNQGEPLVGSNTYAGIAYMNITKRVTGLEVPLMEFPKTVTFWTRVSEIFKKKQEV